MTQITTEQILKEKNTKDPNSITSLTLTHKALTNVSCLSDFKNLERLDLTFNNLTSLKGLEGCVNLKWLSVKENQLVSLKGIEALTNLTVLNVGKNKLRSMEDVNDLVNLRALILNDNEIELISGLDQLKELNTLVLSRNPLYKMGDSLAKLKSIQKISLSNCHLEAIDPSVKACIELEELRLAHNDIQTLPAELGSSKKLRILDIGNNSISRWSDLEALSSLKRLRNLNLLGNPISEKAKLVKKISKLAPSLQILNGKKMEKLNKAEDGALKADDKSISGKKDFKGHDEEFIDSEAKTKGLRVSANTKDDKHKVDLDVAQDDEKFETKKQKKKKGKHIDQEELQNPESKIEKGSKRNAETAGIDSLDDKEISFAQFLAYDAENTKLNEGEKRDNQAASKVDSVSGLVTFPGKKKKAKKTGSAASVLHFLNPVTEVGIGGPSAWDDQ